MLKQSLNCKHIIVLGIILSFSVGLPQIYGDEKSESRQKQRFQQRGKRGGGRMSSRKKDTGSRVEKNGIQVGETLKDIKIFTLKGKEAKLSSMWKEKPALYVTASITCPVAKRQCPSVTFQQYDFSKQVQPVLLYTVEAHPNDGKSPYANFAGRKGRGKYGQPDDMKERLKLANEFHKSVPKIPMLVDGMKNEAWKEMGEGPNLALLVDTNGKVLAKQGWFNAKEMKTAIDKLLKTKVK